MATKTATKASTTETAKVKFNHADLPTEGSVQYRHGGDYKPAISILSRFAKGKPVAVGHVKALIHLGWVRPGGVNNASKSPAFTIADNAGLTKEQWDVGSEAAPQISANMKALADMGAPEGALDALWAAYVGV